MSESVKKLIDDTKQDEVIDIMKIDITEYENSGEMQI